MKLNVFAITYHVRSLIRNEQRETVRRGEPSKEATIQVAAKTAEEATVMALDILDDDDKETTITFVANGTAGVNVETFTRADIQKAVNRALVGTYTQEELDAAVAKAVEASHTPGVSPAQPIVSIEPASEFDKQALREIALGAPEKPIDELPKEGEPAH